MKAEKHDFTTMKTFLTKPIIIAIIQEVSQSILTDIVPIENLDEEEEDTTGKSK